MPVTNETYYNLKRLHGVFAVAAMALLGISLWMWWNESRRPWKEYQRAYCDRMGGDSRPAGIAQIGLPDLTINYHFRKIARCDRCTTCHQGIENPAAEGFPLPHRTHPRLDLFVGAKSPHPKEEFGCTVCHEGQGSATDFRWASHAPNHVKQRRRWEGELGWASNPSWEFPMLPRRFHESRCMVCHREAMALEAQDNASNSAAPNLLAGYHLVQQYGCGGCHEIPAFRKNDANDKVAPSLRHIGGKYSRKYLTARLRKPSDVLSGTRMPQLFGLVEHLSGDVLSRTQALEEAEIQAIVDSLLASGEEIAPPRTISDATASAERGKRLFEIQGCLACHRHRHFPKGEATQGPDLSAAGEKYRSATGEEWLRGWLGDPARYWPRARMPRLFLEPTVLEHGNRVADPAADLAAYLPAGRREQEEESRPGKSHLQRHLSSERIELGRRAMAKRGCAGCHDIPGLEHSPAIGPSLSDWGRKPESFLAFERINDDVRQNEDGGSSKAANTASRNDDYFLDALSSRRREGFAWQKLRGPRTFDARVAHAKPFDEQLKMGRFEFSDAQREAIVGFLIGLVDELPPPRYVARLEPIRQAIVDGRKVLDKYACAECHTLALERWTVDGVEMLGAPRLDRQGLLQEEEGEDGEPVYFFTLWAPAAIRGAAAPAGGADVAVAKSHLLAVRPAWGGRAARLLYPAVLAQAAPFGWMAPEVEAWGWVPPALVHEGTKVRPEWLFRFLRKPMPIRPVAALRMPQFALSQEEAVQLTRYFAAVAGETEPYASQPGIAKPGVDQARLDRAMRLVLDDTRYCAKCHSMGDPAPLGRNRTASAPRLDDVGQRLRPEYLRRWLANPRSVLPYTAMPALFPTAGPAPGQDLFPGSGEEQLDAVAELLFHYDAYVKQRVGRCKDEDRDAEKPSTEGLSNAP